MYSKNMDGKKNTYPIFYTVCLPVIINLLVKPAYLCFNLNIIMQWTLLMIGTGLVSCRIVAFDQT